MNIESTGFKIELSQNELWDIAFAFKHDLEQEDKAAHSAQHSGWKTFEQNYGRAIGIYRTVCNHLGRQDLYEETICLQKKRIDFCMEKKASA